MFTHVRWAAAGAFTIAALLVLADGASAASSWVPMSVPATGNNTQLQAAFMRTSTDGWAVGAQFGLAGQAPPPPIAYHWNGSAWSATTTPSIGFNASLNAVSASATDAWAVGGIAQPGYRRRLALYERWAGGPSWTRVNGPAVGGLNGVVDLSPNNAWAVGALGVVLHWDGTSWTDVTSTVTLPNPSNPFGNNLTAITALSDSDIWAVGKFTNASYVTQAYALHYVKAPGQTTGTWTTMIMDLPSVSGPNSPILHGVVALASNNVWAVGENEEVPGLGLSTLIEHWNGSTWSIVQGPSLNGGAYPALNAIAARSATDMYAVGFDMPSVNGGVQQGLILHYLNGSWLVDNDPTKGTFSPLYGAAAAPLGPEWAVGINSAYQGLVLRNG